MRYINFAIAHGLLGLATVLVAASFPFSLMASAMIRASRHVTRMARPSFTARN